MVTRKVKYPDFDQKWAQILLSCKQLPNLGHLIVQSAHKNISKTMKAWWYIFKINCQLVGGNPIYMVTQEGQIPIFLQKITPNIGIMQIIWPIWTKVATKWHLGQIMMVYLQNYCQQVEVNTIYGHPGGKIPDFLYQ